MISDSNCIVSVKWKFLNELPLKWVDLFSSGLEILSDSDFPSVASCVPNIVAMSLPKKEILILKSILSDRQAQMTGIK